MLTNEVKTAMKAAGIITGKQFAKLMRINKVTIRDLAAKMGLTQGQIRNRRKNGVSDAYGLRDYVEAITGNDPGAFPAWSRKAGI